MTARPIDNLDNFMRNKLRKLRGPRVKELRAYGAPDWLTGAPVDAQLGELSPTVVHLSRVLASPLGVNGFWLPEIAGLAQHDAAMDARYVLEVPRFFRLVDACIRLFVPPVLDHLHCTEAASLLRTAPSVDSEGTFYELYNIVLDATRVLGDARAFEARATNLEEALRVRAVGFGLVSVKHAQTMFDNQFKPSNVIPHMRVVYDRLVVVLAGSRSVAEARLEEFDSEAVGVLRQVVHVDTKILHKEMDKFEREAAREKAN
jgi:hypothetical protein